MGIWRARWAAAGAALAVVLGTGGVGLVSAIDSGERPVAITVPPERVVDTRVDIGLVGALTTQQPQKIQITGEVPVASGGTRTVVPSGATSVIVNVTAVLPPGRGFLSLRPGDATGEPTTSTVNFVAEAIQPNAATVDLAPDGTIQVFAFIDVPNGQVDLLLDIVGYTVDHTHDDRYYTQGEVDALLASARVGRVLHLNVNSTGQVRDVHTSPELLSTTVTRPAGQPAGHFCVDVPNGVVSQFGAVGSVQQTFTTGISGPDTIRLMTVLNGLCGSAGLGEIEVRLASDAGILEDGSFTLLLPTVG